MIAKFFILLFSALVAITAATQDVCLQGCCDMKLKLDSSSLNLVSHNEQEKSELQLGSPEIKCCPCDSDDISVEAQALEVQKFDGPDNLISKICPDDSDQFRGDRLCACKPCISCTGCSGSLPNCASRVKLHASFRDPEDRKVCETNKPCDSSCICPSALVVHDSQNKIPEDSKIDGQPVCPQGQPCTADCICTLENLITYYNPNDLSISARICPQDKCDDECICRDQLLKSFNSVLFPAKGKRVINFAPPRAEVKDEL